MATFQSNADAAKIVRWRAMDLTSPDNTSDPNTILNGSVSLSSGFYQIPVSSSTNRVLLNNCLRFDFNMPSDFNAGEPYVLLTRMILQSKPTGAYGISSGIADVSTGIGIAMGMRNRTVSAQIRAIATRWGSNTEAGSDFNASALQSVASIVAAGAFDGSATTFSAAVALSDGTGATRNWSTTNTGTQNINSANLRTVFAVIHNSTTLETETIGVKAEYAYVAYDGFLS